MTIENGFSTITWIKFLTNESTSPERKRRAAARGIYARLLDITEREIVTQLELLLERAVVADICPISGTVSVDVFGAYKHSIYHKDGSCQSAFRHEKREWIHTGDRYPKHMALPFDRFLSGRVWKRRLRNSVLDNTLERLVGADWKGHRWSGKWYLQPDVRFAERLFNIAAGRVDLKARINRVDRIDLRRRIRRALGLDQELLVLARQCMLTVSSELTVNDHWMSFVIRHRAELERIRQETPTLLAPVATLAYSGVVPELSVRAFKSYVLGQGIGEGAYKILAQRGVRPFRYVLRYFHAKRYASDESIEPLVAALRMCHGSNTIGTPPRAMQKSACEIYLRKDTGYSLRHLLERVPPHVLEVARQRFSQCTQSNVMRTSEEFVDILTWIKDFKRYGAVEEARTLKTWSAWLRRAHEAMTREMWNIERMEWNARTADFQLAGVKLRTLRDSVAVQLEGRRMRHCLGDYVHNCSSGSMIFFNADSGGKLVPSVVTIGLQNTYADDGTWSVRDIRGSCNVHPGRAWRRFGEQLAAHYNQLPADDQVDNQGDLITFLAASLNG